MSRLVQASFALRSTGKVVVVNVAEFDGVSSLEDAFTWAGARRVPVFVGLGLEGHEAADLLERVKHMGAEAAAHIVGRQQRRTRGGR